MASPFLSTGLSTLYCGDCEAVLSEAEPRFDKIITSPPYNTRRDCHDVCYDVHKDGMPNDEYIAWTLRLFGLFDRLMNPNGLILWNMSYGGENPELMPLCVAEIVRSTPFTLADVLVWRKSNAWPNNVSPNKTTRICEFVYAFCRRSEYATFTSNKRIVSRDAKTGQARYETVYNMFDAPNGDSIELNHSTFSVEFVDELIRRYVLASDSVLDPFCGTGTTMVACESRGIRGTYVELSEAQCEYARDRVMRPTQLKLI